MSSPRSPNYTSAGRDLSISGLAPLDDRKPLPAEVVTDIISGRFEAERSGLELLRQQIFGGAGEWLLTDNQVCIEYGRVSAAGRAKSDKSWSFLCVRFFVTHAPSAETRT